MDCRQSSNNQRLGSAGDNDRRSKGSVAPTLCFAYFSLDRCLKHAWIRRRGVEGRNAGDQIAFCAFHTFLTNAGYVHATHAQ